MYVNSLFEAKIVLSSLPEVKFVPGYIAETKLWITDFRVSFYNQRILRWPRKNLNWTGTQTGEASPMGLFSRAVHLYSIPCRASCFAWDDFE